MPLATSGVIIAWSAINALATVSLSSYRDADLLKRAAIIHITFALIAFCFLSWQALALYTSLQVGVSLLAARSIRYLSGKEAQIDYSGRIFALKNHLETLEHEPPYNVFYGRLYPANALAPLAIAAHSLHLTYLYLKGVNPTPKELEAEALTALRQEALTIFNELSEVYDRPHTQTSPPHIEKELLAWHIEIAPLLGRPDIRERLEIDGQTANRMERFHKSLERNATLFLWRQLLSEPIPESDLLHLIKEGALPDSSYTLKIWVHSYNLEKRLNFDHLRTLLSRLNEKADAKAIDKALFLLMDKCGLLPYKGPEHKLDDMHPIPGVVRVDRVQAILHFADKPSLSAYKIAWPRIDSLISLKDHQKEYFEIVDVSETSLKMERLKPSGERYREAYQEPPVYHGDLDSLWSIALSSWLDKGLSPSFFMDQFIFVGGKPLLVNPYYHVKKSSNIENWLLLNINPTDQGRINQWRITLCEQYGFKHLAKHEAAFRELCRESSAPHYLRFTYTLREEDKRGATMRGHVEETLRTWHEGCKELVCRVQNRYHLDQESALKVISEMFEREYNKPLHLPRSPLHAFKFCSSWPIDHFMALIDQAYNQ